MADGLLGQSFSVRNFRIAEGVFLWDLSYLCLDLAS